jgi:glycosyltransferase involved in cell wall biosynthesis
VTGRVDDVRPYLERASVFAAPLRFGAGIQNKVLEAMAMEVPVVASTLAADGLRLDEGSSPPIEIADDPATVAAGIVRHLRAAEAGAAPAGDERRFVSSYFSWEASGAVLETVLLETAGSARFPVAAGAQG